MYFKQTNKLLLIISKQLDFFSFCGNGGGDVMMMVGV